MRNVLHFFTKTVEDTNNSTAATTWMFKEPKLTPPPDSMAQPLEKPLQNPGQDRPLRQSAAPSQPHSQPPQQMRPAQPATSAPPSQSPPSVKSGGPPRESPPSSSPARAKSGTPRETLPTEYEAVTEYFYKTVSERQSPFNALMNSANKLKDFLPDEISRLKAAYAICAEQIPREELAVAIATHVADIENARLKAREAGYGESAQKSEKMRREAEQIAAQNGGIKEEIRSLSEKIAALEATLKANSGNLAALNEEIARTKAHSMSFIDQAAENITNDLLAKKVLLGLS